jgi:hypothetical protein
MSRATARLGPSPGPADAAARVRRLLQHPRPVYTLGRDSPLILAIRAPPPRPSAARGRAGQQAALLLGQVRGDQLVEPAQHGIDVHAATDRLGPVPVGIRADGAVGSASGSSSRHATAAGRKR